MKKYIIVVLVLILIIAGTITFFVIDLNKDTEATQKVMEEINEYYKKYEENIDDYNLTRDKLITQTSSYYNESFKENYSNILVILNDYDEIMNQTTLNVTIIDNNCANHIFNNSKTNTICKNYQESYEQMTNIFLTDVENFNNLVETYNKSTTEQLEKYNSNYIKDYLDYNKDGKYEGKN
jgi:hypothetical protein